tara:strand:- start:1458 stop:2054 length:597 start_codon:yes stop_codon:yes gene_type:complete
MIVFENNCDELPFKEFRDAYKRAHQNGQMLIHAASISSFSKTINEVNSRFVNIKFLDNDRFIFFSNYKSPKSNEFSEHDQIAALFFWDSINVQIRIKARIKKTSQDINNRYFKNRSIDKNALSISSRQSKEINSFSDVKSNFDRVLQSEDLRRCPNYWGGFSFTPYYFEFWEGHELRLNKRDAYKLKNNSWDHSILQP